MICPFQHPYGGGAFSRVPIGDGTRHPLLGKGSAHMSQLELDCLHGSPSACDALRSWSFVELWMTIGLAAVAFWAGWVAYSRYCDWRDEQDREE